MRVAMDEKLTKSVGREVEVCYKDNGFGSIWYKAIIELTPLTKHRSKNREFRVRLLKDDFATPFTKLSGNVLVRPVPPVHVQARIDVEEGCVVDASWQNEWWTGLVVKVIEKDKFSVYFDSPHDVIQFDRKDLRAHLDWIDEKHWVVKGPNLEVLKRLTEESMFSSGTMVEVSCKINKVEVVWVPAMIVKEFEEGNKETVEDDKENEDGDEENAEDENEEDENDDEIEDDDEENDETEEEIEETGDDEKKYVVKFCDKSLSCKDNKARLNKTVGLHSIRPTPPPFWVEEYQLREYVEALHGTRWRQGQVMGFRSQKQILLLLKATNQELIFKHSDLRPLKMWEDGVWKTKEVPLTQASGNTISGSVTNGNTPSRTKESCPPVTPSPGVTTQGKTPLKQAETETQGKTPKRTLLRMRNQTRANENSENNNRKRKREENASSAASVEETEANDSTIVLPFEKKLLSIWKKVESMEAFQTVPQTPHFRPLMENEQDSRETHTIGMMFTYSALIEQVKGLQFSTPISTLKGLTKSFAVLEKNGFDVKEPRSQIHKVLSLKDMQAKKTEEVKHAKKELEEKILEVQKIKEKADKELEDAEIQFQSIFSTPR